MARYDVNDRPQTAQAVNVGQFGPSYDSLQDWRSVFIVANEIRHIRDQILGLDEELDKMLAEIQAIAEKAEEAATIALEVAATAQEQIGQAVADIKDIEANIIVMGEKVTIAEAAAKAAAEDAQLALQTANEILAIIETYVDDFTNLNVKLETPEAGPGVEPEANFDNVTNTLTLIIPKISADVNLGDVDLDTPASNDYIVGLKNEGSATPNKTVKFNLADITAGLSTGTKVLGLWTPDTNTVELDPYNSSLTKGTGPSGPTSGSIVDGGGYTVTADGDFPLYGASADPNHFLQGDFIQWSSTASSWIHQKIGSKVSSVNGKKGDVVITAKDLSAIGEVGTYLLEGDYKLKDTQGRIRTEKGQPIVQVLTENLELGNAVNKTTLIGSALEAKEPNPVVDPDKPYLTGRIFHSGNPPSVEDLKLNVYTKEETYNQTELNDTFQVIDKLIKDKTPLPSKDLKGKVVWDTETNSWVSIGKMGSLPVGSIVAYYADEAPIPQGFLECNGAPVSQELYPDLYALCLAGYKPEALDLWLGDKEDFVSTTNITSKKIQANSGREPYFPGRTGQAFTPPDPLADGKFLTLVTPQGRTDLVAKLSFYSSISPKTRAAYYFTMVRGTWADFTAAALNKPFDCYKIATQSLGTKIKTTAPVTYTGRSDYGSSTLGDYTNGVGTFIGTAEEAVRAPITRCISWRGTSEETSAKGHYHLKLATPAGRKDLIVRLSVLFEYNAVNPSYMYQLEPVKGTVDEFCSAVAGKAVDIYEPTAYTKPVPPGSALLPDLRGEFIRGWDHNKGVDPLREFGSFQDSAYGPVSAIRAVANETRPRNVALMYIIKALDPEIPEDKTIVNKLAHWVDNDAVRIEEKIDAVPGIFRSTADPTPDIGVDGDVWFVY